MTRYSTNTNVLFSMLDMTARLLYLEPNWDSYGAPPISKAAISEALRYLLTAPEERLGPAYAMPRNDGGVVLEWRLRTGTLELVFTAVNTVEASWLTTEDVEVEVAGEATWELLTKVLDG